MSSYPTNVKPWRWLATVYFGTLDACNDGFTKEMGVKWIPFVIWALNWQMGNDIGWQLFEWIYKHRVFLLGKFFPLLSCP